MADAGTHSAGGDGIPLRILFFEDEAADIELALLTLRAAGFLVVADVVATLPEITQRVRAQAYDVILSDYRMPSATGMDAFAVVRARDADVPFILLTGSLGDEKAVECVKQGVADYVLKDHLARLPIAVRRALEEKRLRHARAAAEDALRRSAAGYRSLIDSASFAIFRLSATQDRFLAVNPSLAEVLGYAAAQDLLQLVLSRDVYVNPNATREILQAGEKLGQITAADTEWRRRDGSRVAVRLSGRFLRDAADGAFFEMVAEDVTARRRSEERVAQLNRLYSMLTHVNQAIVRLRDRDELLREICRIAVEEGHFDMAWVGRGDAQGLHIQPVVQWGMDDGCLKTFFAPGADEAAGHGPAGTSLRTGRHAICFDTTKGVDFPTCCVQAIGRGYRSIGGFPLSVQNVPVGVLVLYATSGFFDEETVALLDELAADVSFALEGMHQAELGQRAVDELNQFFTVSLDLLCIGDLEGRLHRLNPAWEKTLGFTPAELQSMTFTDLVHPDDLNHAHAALCRLRAGTEVTDVEIRFRSKAGAYRWLMCNATPAPQACLVFVAACDITDRKALEMQLVQQNTALEQQNQRVEAANRMKSEFLANMSHELRSPLNGIIGFTELLYDQRVGRVSARQKDLLGRVLSSSRHLLQLINDVLDVAKVEAGRLEFRPERVLLPKLVQEVTGTLARITAEKQIDLSTEIDPAIGQVVADPARLKQVLYNYLSNALKFTSEKGRVAVRVNAEGPGEFRLEVTDNGIGIAVEDLPRLFVEFQQLDAGTAKRFPGTGLGLAFTKRIVEAQGGRVGVESEPGSGARFFAILPTAPRQPGASRPSPQVLVIEGERIDRHLLAGLLERAGCVVQPASTGAEALSLCSRQAFDLVTLDWFLPDANGSEVLDRMRKLPQHRQTPVIAISRIEGQSPAGFAGVQEFIPKPVDGQVLLAALERSGVVVETAGV